MGSFLGEIHGKSVAVDSALLNSTHSKLIEYYSSYKSICEGFTISIPEYTQIFGPNQLSFAVWDSKGKGKIDAIQMFSGLLIFSKIKYEQKIKFLFEIFDFNEEGFLLYENLAFMLLNICNATYKIFCISKTVAQNQIEMFLDQYFTQDSRIELQKLVRWTTKNKFTVQYFKSIGYQIDQPIEQRRIDAFSISQYQSLRKKNPPFISDKQFRFDSKYINCLDTLVDKRQIDQKQMMNLQFKWLYGIEVGKENIKFVRVKKQKAGNQRIIYSIGKIIIIYYPKLNIQQYYKGHTEPISVIQVSKFNKLVASAEYGQCPSIHIWDIQNRVNLIKFKRIHKQRIKFMKFFRNDKYLITASESIKFGGQIESPIIILKLDTKEVVMSTYLNMEIIGILPIDSIKQSTALLISKTFLTIFTQENRTYTAQKKQLKNGYQTKQIIAFVLHPKGYLITAHKNRQFCKWDQNYNCIPIVYQSQCSKEIIQICFIGQQTLLVLDEHDVEVINIKIQDNLPLKRRKMFGLFQTQLYNLRLYSMQVIEQNKLLLVSQFGDVMKISQIQSKQIRFQKYYQLFKMDQISNMILPNSNSIVLITSLFIYVVDRYEKQLKVLLKQECQIKLSDSYKDNLLITSNNDNQSTLTIISLHDYSMKQTYKLPCFVQDIKITQNHILALSQISLNIFHRVQDKYFSKQPTLLKLSIGKMLSFARQNDQKACIVVNQIKQIYKIPFNGNSQEIQKIDKQQDFNQFQKLSISYPEHNYKYPFVFSSNRRFVALGRKNGDVFVWESLSQAINYFSSHTLLNFHVGRISRLLLTDDQFFTVGGFNGMVIQYQHQKYIQVQEDNEILQLQEDEGNGLQKIPITKTKWKQNDIKNTIVYKELQGVGLREGQVQILGIEDTEDNQIYSLILQILTPSNKMYYQPSKQRSNANKLVLQTDYIYGIDVNLMSKNVHYIHCYSCESINNRSLDERLWHDNSAETNKEELKYCKNVLLPIDDDHSNCKRQILYTSGKYCVIDQKNAPQQLYKFHRRKVSTVAVHPNKQLICSCQVSSLFAQIHFWKYHQRSLYISFTSKHRSIITKAQFSRDGQWLVTLGGIERAQSIQIINWQNQQTIAFRFVQDESIRQILFNPYDKKQLSLAGLNLIRIYRVQEELIIKEECRVLQQNFQTIAYISNIYGSEIESDVITGSLQGDIGLYVCGSFLYSRKKAHDKGITCLRIVELFQYKKVLVSGGNDGYVRIWDIKFNQISKKNIRDELYSIKSGGLDMPETIIVNIDVFQCQKKQANQNTASALMLIATSDGSILQATITNEFQGYKAVNLTTAETQLLKEKINFDTSLILASPPNQYSFKFQVLNNLLVTYSSKSKFLYFWNMNFHTRQRIFSLPSPPIFLTKMKKKPILLIGIQQSSFIVLKMYQLEFSAGIYLRSITQCGQIQLQKGNFIPMNGYFSKSDNQLALQIKSQINEQIWIYKKSEGIEGNCYQYAFRIGMENDVLSRIMWIQFSTAEESILVAQCELKKQSHLDKQVKYKCYDCNNGSSLGLGYEFDRFDFSAKVRAQYLPCSHLLTQNQKDYSAKDAANITLMIEYKQYLLMGTSSGQILIAQSEIFAKKQLNPRYYAHCYVVCDSPINKLQIHQSDIIVSSELGEAIYILKMKIQKGLESKQVYIDPFNQNYPTEQLEKRHKQVYLKRKKIQSESQCTNSNCAVGLKLSAVFGRNAFYKRNNIFIDLKDNIISFSGCNLLIMKPQQGQRLYQKIIKPDISPNTSHPEISCMALGDCKRFLVIGTNQQNSKIIAWDISTNTYLFDIKLSGSIIINLIKLSFSNKHCLVYATAKNSHKYFYLIDLISRNVIAVHHFHTNIQINDFSFALHQQFRILACGVKYMAQWNYCNGILAQKNYSFNLGENQEMKTNAIIFYSLIFIQDYAISCGSDGYLYIWKDEKLVKRQNAHPKESILTLYTSLNSKIFVSGANNGIVIIWHFSSSLIIQKLDQYSTYFGKQHLVPIKYQIQSICMTKQSLIIGNRAGEIMHFPFSADSKKMQLESSTASNKVPLPILSAFNHVTVNSCAFNASSKKLYVMTEAQCGFGTFSVFDVATLQKIKQQKIQLKSPLVKMFVCKNSTKIFFILKNLILTYVYQAQGKDDKNKLSKGKQSLKFDLQIKAAAINKAQSFLAILIAPGPLQNARIQIYNLNAPKDLFYAIYKSEENLQASVDVIDFCRTHNYLVYQGPDQEQTIIDLMTKQKIKAGVLQNPPEWNDQANKTTPSIRQITTFYSQENKLLRIVQVINKCVIATDEIGSVRIFPYPITANKQQNYQAYIEHLNQIYLCVLSPDNRILVTVSRQDRAIHLWDVTYKQKQCII